MTPLSYDTALRRKSVLHVLEIVGGMEKATPEVDVISLVHMVPDSVVCDLPG